MYSVTHTYLFISHLVKRICNNCNKFQLTKTSTICFITLTSHNYKLQHVKYVNKQIKQKAMSRLNNINIKIRIHKCKKYLYY